MVRYRYEIMDIMFVKMGSVEDLVERNLSDLAELLPPSGRLVLVDDSGESVGIGCLKTIAPGIGNTL